MTVAEMLDRISSRELTEWMIFYGHEPFGSEADFLGHAITSSTIANVNRPKGKKALKPEEFMPKFEKKKPQSTDEMINIAAMYAAISTVENTKE